MTSARSIAIAFLIHVVILSLVWIGFPVPFSRNNIEIAYSGSYLPTQDSSQQQQMQGQGAVTHAVSLRTPEAGNFPPWVESRGLDKPRK